MQTDFSARAETSDGVGNALRRAREERGQTLQDASQATRIWASYLQALEDDAPSDQFPAPIYAKFFLREYAQHLGIPDGPLVEALDARWGTEPPELVFVPTLKEPRRWARRLTTAAVAVALVGVLVVAVASRTRHTEGPAIGALPSTEPTQSRTPAVASGQSHRGGGRAHTVGIVAMIQVHERCWVWADADGQIVAQQTYDPGQRVTLHAARALTLTLGNAPGVTLEVNGRTVAAGTTSVSHLTVEYRNGEAVVT